IVDPGDSAPFAHEFNSMRKRLELRERQFDGVGVATHRKCGGGRRQCVGKVVSTWQPEIREADASGKVIDCELECAFGGPDRRFTCGPGKSKPDHLRADLSRELPDSWIVAIEYGPIAGLLIFEQARFDAPVIFQIAVSVE